MNELDAHTFGLVLVQQGVNTLEQVIREYRTTLADHRYCRRGINPHVKIGKEFDNRCPTCVAADIALGVE